MKECGCEVTRAISSLCDSEDNTIVELVYFGLEVSSYTQTRSIWSFEETDSSLDNFDEVLALAKQVRAIVRNFCEERCFESRHSVKRQHLRYSSFCNGFLAAEFFLLSIRKLAQRRVFVLLS